MVNTVKVDRPILQFSSHATLINKNLGPLTEFKKTFRNHFVFDRNHHNRRGRHLKVNLVEGESVIAALTDLKDLSFIRAFYSNSKVKLTFSIETLSKYYKNAVINSVEYNPFIHVLAITYSPKDNLYGINTDYYKYDHGHFTRDDTYTIGKFHTSHPQHEDTVLDFLPDNTIAFRGFDLSLPEIKSPGLEKVNILEFNYDVKAIDRDEALLVYARLYSYKIPYTKHEDVHFEIRIGTFYTNGIPSSFLHQK
jgi:hypothetical protein